jgi:hypothetical protein
MSIETIYSLQGLKCQALHGPDEGEEEVEGLEQLDWSNKYVDLGSNASCKSIRAN